MMKYAFVSFAKFLLLVAIAALHPANTWSQPFEIEELLALPDIQGYISSREGDVTWVERSGPSFSINIARAPEYEPARLISFDDDVGLPISLVGFGPDNEVLFVRGKQNFNPAHEPLPTPRALTSVNENDPSPQIIIPNLSSGFSRPVISSDQKTLYFVAGATVYRLHLRNDKDPEQIFQVRGRITDLLVSPDSRKLAFVSDRSSYNRGRYSFVGIFDLDANKITYMEPGLGYDQDIAWSPDSRKVAFIRFGYEPKTWRFSDHREGAPFDVIVADSSTGEGNAVFTSEPGYGSRFNGFASSGYTGLGGSGSLIWLADGTLLFPYEKTGWKHIYAIPSHGGDVIPVTEGAFEVHTILSSVDRSSAYFLSNSEDDLARLGLYKLAPETGMRKARIPFDEAGGDAVVARGLARWWSAL